MSSSLPSLNKYFALNKGYEELPPRIRQIVSEQDFRVKAFQYCVEKGLVWKTSIARTCTLESTYYEALIAAYRHKKRLFPYHLSEYLCRVMRTTPFRYYRDILEDAMKSDLPYDAIPNFTAADIVKLIGIGRNEYIAIMVQAKSKKLMWKMNKGLVRDLLPPQPLPPKLEPWWVVHVVNLNDGEYTGLTQRESHVCNLAAQDSGMVCSKLDTAVVLELYKKGLVWIEVPVLPEDQFMIPPLEGFVSNKTSVAADSDPIESLLYQIFVAASDRLSVAQLASMLSVDFAAVQFAISIACRLGFCRKLQQRPAQPDAFLAPVSPTNNVASLEEALQSPGDQMPVALLNTDVEQWNASSSSGGSIALIVDARVTGLLMMGALTPGCKKHSVTLFEGGRVYGSGVVEDLLNELIVSASEAEHFEGEMQALASYTKGLATALQFLMACKGSRSVELLRKEAISSLPIEAATKILQHSYFACVVVSGLPPPPLSTPLDKPPYIFGPFGAAATPWLNVAVCSAVNAALPGLVFPAGHKLTRLPPQLERCKAAVCWAWEGGVEEILVERRNLLLTLNDYLPTTAILVQPLSAASLNEDSQLETVAVPLPLIFNKNTEKHSTSMMLADSSSISLSSSSPNADVECEAYREDLEGTKLVINLPSTWEQALNTLGLAGSIGYLRLIQHKPQDNDNDGARQSEVSPQWLPLQVRLGMPIHHPALCTAVCHAANSRNALGADACRQYQESRKRLEQRLARIWALHASSRDGGSPPVESVKSMGGGGVHGGSTTSGGVGPPVRDMVLDTQGRLLVDGHDIEELKSVGDLMGALKAISSVFIWKHLVNRIQTRNLKSTMSATVYHIGQRMFRCLSIKPIRLTTSSTYRSSHLLRSYTTNSTRSLNRLTSATKPLRSAQPALDVHKSCFPSSTGAPKNFNSSSSKRRDFETLKTLSASSNHEENTATVEDSTTQGDYSKVNYCIVNFYHLTDIEKPHALIEQHRQFLEGKEVRGRVYISEQGINAQYGGVTEDAVAYAEWISTHPKFQGLRYSVDAVEEHMFPKLRLKYRPNLISLAGGMQSLPITNPEARATPLPPQKWREMIENGDNQGKQPIMLDVRNSYEWDAGHFSGAARPLEANFNETPTESTPDEVPAYLQEADPETPVMMYCTGGIRCDVYSTYLRAKGFKNLYTLEGGIQNYMKSEGLDHWKGSLYVFDGRMAIRPDKDKAAELVAAAPCQVCDGEAVLPHANCANIDCNKLFIACTDCKLRYNGCCCEACTSAPRLLRPVKLTGQYGNWTEYASEDDAEQKMAAGRISRRRRKQMEKEERDKAKSALKKQRRALVEDLLLAKDSGEEDKLAELKKKLAALQEA